jgi:hypothetical protein
MIAETVAMKRVAERAGHTQAEPSRSQPGAAIDRHASHERGPRLIADIGVDLSLRSSEAAHA